MYARNKDRVAGNRVRRRLLAVSKKDLAAIVMYLSYEPRVLEINLDQGLMKKARHHEASLVYHTALASEARLQSRMKEIMAKESDEGIQRSEELEKLTQRLQRASERVETTWKTHYAGMEPDGGTP